MSIFNTMPQHIHAASRNVRLYLTQYPCCRDRHIRQPATLRNTQKQLQLCQLNPRRLSGFKNLKASLKQRDYLLHMPRTAT